ncbi:hypothetical protein C8R45DRAFT_1080765 [Mycena sanguinolenta]|nr:hypothetical protein C8R45DRAFT_1080765 [Mycena sanguinolenta]
MPSFTLKQFCEKYGLNGEIKQRLENAEFKSLRALLEVSKEDLESIGFRPEHTEELKKLQIKNDADPEAQLCYPGINYSRGRHENEKKLYRRTYNATMLAELEKSSENLIGPNFQIVALRPKLGCLYASLGDILGFNIFWNIMVRNGNLKSRQVTNVVFIGWNQPPSWKQRNTRLQECGIGDDCEVIGMPDEGGTLSYTTLATYTWRHHNVENGFMERIEKQTLAKSTHGYSAPVREKSKRIGKYEYHFIWTLQTEITAISGTDPRQRTFLVNFHIGGTSSVPQQGLRKSRLLILAKTRYLGAKSSAESYAHLQLAPQPTPKSSRPPALL